MEKNWPTKGDRLLKECGYTLLLSETLKDETTIQYRNYDRGNILIITPTTVSIWDGNSNIPIPINLFIPIAVKLNDLASVKIPGWENFNTFDEEMIRELTTLDAKDDLEDTKKASSMVQEDFNPSEVDYQTEVASTDKGSGHEYEECPDPQYESCADSCDGCEQHHICYPDPNVGLNDLIQDLDGLDDMLDQKRLSIIVSTPKYLADGYKDYDYEDDTSISIASSGLSQVERKAMLQAAIENLM